MKKTNPTTSLTEAIADLERKQSFELQQFKDQLHVTYESLKPLNLIKSTILQAGTSPNLKSNLFNNAIGLSTGYLLKRILVGSSAGPVKKLMGFLLQFVITNVVAKKVGGGHPSENQSSSN